MDCFTDDRDLELLQGDCYTFFVLRKVIAGKCELLLTDHERLLICYTGKPYPIWIWTPDDASDTELEEAYRIISEHFMINGEHHFNMKYSLAEFFIERATADGKTLAISTNMFAYTCEHPVEPTQIASGSIHQCDNDDIDELVDFLDLFHNEVGIDQKSRDDYRRDAEAYIKSKTMFFWTDDQGNSVASCKYVPNGDMASINLVYTRPEFRRKHYAQNLVYQVSQLAVDAHYMPMLYTDADYVASNACYEKIGYVRRGSLCTIG